MIKHLVSFLLATILAAPLAAQTPMDAEAFETYSQGKTLYFGRDGAPYGAEEYLPNRRVRWSVLDGECQDGTWYQDDQMICFVYENNPEPQCWSFYQQAGGLMAQYRNDPKQNTLFEIKKTKTPMICLGPEVGV